MTARWLGAFNVNIEVIEAHEPRSARHAAPKSSRPVNMPCPIQAIQAPMIPQRNTKSPSRTMLMRKSMPRAEPTSRPVRTKLLVEEGASGLISRSIWSSMVDCAVFCSVFPCLCIEKGSPGPMFFVFIYRMKGMPSF